MKNIIEICKEFGLEVPADKTADFSKAVADNYLTKAEHEKKLGKVESDRDNWKSKAETAEEALKGFEGVDLKTIQENLAAYKKKAEDAEKNYADKMAARDFEDALKSEMEAFKFSSEAAKKSVMEEIRAAGLKVKDGKILGLSDLVENIKKNDASAFVDVNNAPARFTSPLRNDSAKKYTDKTEIMKIKDASERQTAIAQHLALFGKGE